MREKNNGLFLLFPRSYEEEFFIDPSIWLTFAVNFEGQFDNCYPEFKQNKKERFRKAKTLSLQALDNIDRSQCNKKERDYLDDCRMEIERYEGLLEEKFNFVVSENIDILEKIIKYNADKHNVNYKEYGGIYKEYRNNLAHGTITPITSKENAVFKVMRAMIYILILKDTGLSKFNLSIIINKLFC